MIERRLVSAALANMIATVTGKPCSRRGVPMNGDVPVPPPYYLLHALPAVYSGPPYADDHTDASLTYQVTCVSGPDPAQDDSRGEIDQAEWLADKARGAVLGRDPVTGAWLNPLTVPGWRNYCREHDTEPGESGDPADAIISYVIRFRLDWTPA